MGLTEAVKRSFMRKQFARVAASGRAALKAKSFEQARSIGLVYLITDEAGQQLITSWVNSLQESRKEVHALGLYTGKAIPHFCFPKISFDYLHSKNLNWYGKPAGDKVRDFVQQPFDMLINLDLTGNVSLQYICAASAASFKVGLQNGENDSILDFMIIPGEISTVQQLITQTGESLKMFFR